MKKAIILALAFVMVIGVSAMATETRTVVMGQNNHIMLDDANVWLYPSRINNYPNIATAEANWDYDDMYNVGVNWKFGEENPWVLGTYFSTNGEYYPQGYTGNPLGNMSYLYYGPSMDAAAKQQYITYGTGRSFDLLYGRKLGTFNFGFGLGYNHASYKSEESGDETEEAFTQYTVSLGITPDAGNWDVAAHIAMGSWTDKDSDGADQSESDGYSDIAILGRYFHKMNNTVTLVPHAMIAFGSRGEKFTGDYEANTDYKEKLTSFEVGVGMNYTPVTNVLAVLDFGFWQDKLKYETEGAEDETESWTSFPYWRLGLEGEVFNWLDVRAGATSDWGGYKWEDNYKYGSIMNETYFGAGLNFNRLHIDTYMDPEILLDGFNFISGSTDQDDLNFQVSVLYEMF